MQPRDIQILPLAEEVSITESEGRGAPPASGVSESHQGMQEDATVLGQGDSRSPLPQEFQGLWHPSHSGKIGVVESVYYRYSGAPACDSTSRFVRLITSDEQVYDRKLTIGEQWVKLDTGWLADKVGLLKIENLEGQGLWTRSNPTNEQLEELRQKIIEVGIIPPTETEDKKPMKVLTFLEEEEILKPMDQPIPMFYIPPTESMRGTPVQASRLWLRCCKGKAKIRVFALPGD